MPISFNNFVDTILIRFMAEAYALPPRPPTLTHGNPKRPIGEKASHALVCERGIH